MGKCLQKVKESAHLCLKISWTKFEKEKSRRIPASSKQFNLEIQFISISFAKGFEDSKGNEFACNVIDFKAAAAIWFNDLSTQFSEYPEVPNHCRNKSFQKGTLCKKNEKKDEKSKQPWKTMSKKLGKSYLNMHIW